jgi:excisionase family DNA binding protein
MADSLRGIGEVAKLFGVSHFTIRRLIDAGHIRAVNIGTRWLIPNAEVERVLASGAGIPRKRKSRASGTCADAVASFTRHEA